MSANQWELVTKSKRPKKFDRKNEKETESTPIATNLQPNAKPYKGNGFWEDMPLKLNNKQAKEPLNAVSTQRQEPQRNVSKVKATTSVSSIATTKPKTLEQAVRKLTVEDFNTQLEQLKLSFIDSELQWLKGVATYLNDTLPFNMDADFSNKSAQYPSNLLAPSLKSEIINFLEVVGEETLSYFYQMLLSSMAMEMSKNVPVLGYKLLLQLIGQHWPNICSTDMVKTVLLRNSYQNRSNICLSIFWVIGQGGQKNLSEGIKVWQNLMLPCLELKSYSKYVVQYIERILTGSSTQTLILPQSEFFVTYNALRQPYTALSKPLQDSLNSSAEILLTKYIASTSKHANIFLKLFQSITHAQRQRIELNGCLMCLLHGHEDSFKVWKMNYKKYVLASTLLLQRIYEKGTEGSFVFSQTKEFQNFLLELQTLNAELLAAKKRDANLDNLIAILENVQSSSSTSSSTSHNKKRQNAAQQQKKKCGCCKWVLSSVFLLGLIGVVLTYDTQVNGQGVFARSATGKALQKAGLLPHVEKAWYTTMSASARGYKWAQKNVPPYASPAIKLTTDLLKLLRLAACNAFTSLQNFVNAKLPVAAQFLEQYLPGLPKKIEDTSVIVKGVAVDAYARTVAFFKTQVLVGPLSPENLSKTLNDTQNVAQEYLNLFHKKVDAYAKLK